METSKSHNLLSANWRTRKAGDVFHAESKGLKTREAKSVRPRLKAQEWGISVVKSWSE